MVSPTSGFEPLTAAGRATELRIELGGGSGVIGPTLPRGDRRHNTATDAGGEHCETGPWLSDDAEELTSVAVDVDQPVARKLRGQIRSRRTTFSCAPRMVRIPVR